MVNVNKIKIIVIDLEGQEPPVELFDLCEYDEHRLVGVIVVYKSLTPRLEKYDYTLYDISDSTLLENMYDTIEHIKHFIGVDMSIDEILDIILESNVERRFYLESYLYYKSTQEGKPINQYTIDVKYYDDFIHFMDEDVISDEVLSNNEDFSQSQINIETYLTKSEMIIKFKDYLVGIVK